MVRVVSVAAVGEYMSRSECADGIVYGIPFELEEEKPKPKQHKPRKLLRRKSVPKVQPTKPTSVGKEV